MHIAWLGKKSPFCGNVTYSREITNALSARGHRISFLHFADSHESQSNDAHEVSLPCIYKSQGYTIPTLKASKVLSDALTNLRPDLVHASLTLSPLDFRLPEICQQLGIPLVATFHPPFDSKVRNFKSSAQLLAYQFYAPFLARYNRVIIFSYLQRELLIKLGVPAAKLAVIPNGVDEDRYLPGYSEIKHELNCDRLFVYQGRIATAKNVEALLKAWKSARMGKRSKLLIVGDGPLAENLKNTYRCESNTVWLGFVASEARRIEILKGADVFILPSLVEGLSLSLLEAMACGVACLATDAGADGEVLGEGAGIILEPQEVTSQLKILLPTLRDHPEMAKILGQKARQRILERYTLTRNVTALENLYASLRLPISQPVKFLR